MSKPPTTKASGPPAPAKAPGRGVHYLGAGRPACSAGKPAPPLRKAIPIVFVPGIMGSNLVVRSASREEVKQHFKDEDRLEDYTNEAWAPPNVLYSGVEIARTLLMDLCPVGHSGPTRIGRRWQSYGPKFRQIMLNPETTEVDENGFIPEDLPALDGRKGMSVARERGWGTAHWDSYGEFLCFLQRQLNPLPELPGIPKTGRKAFLEAYFDAVIPQKAHGLDFPTEKELDRAAAFHFPVFVFGYNWTRSNLEAAERLLIKIRQWLKWLQQADHLDCTKVILVTHSMGGLVARIASQLDQAGQQSILGVVHGVQPATGAPILYGRTVVGHEDKKLHLFLHQLSSIERRMMGETRAETTPVITNAPGCLELLPSHLYPPGWLTWEKEIARGTFKVDKVLPQTHDPYTEIYREKNGYWRLADPDLMDPAGLITKKERELGPVPPDCVWRKYLERIDQVEAVHRTYFTRKGYHKNTYAFFGASAASYHAIHLRKPAKPRAYQFNASGRFMEAGWPSWGDAAPGSGLKPTLPSVLAQPPVPVLMKATGKGDGTVPEESGQAPQGRVKHLKALKGVSHASAYHAIAARAYTIFSICRMAAAFKA